MPQNTYTRFPGFTQHDISELADLSAFDRRQSPSNNEPMAYEVAIDAFLADDLLFFSIPEHHRSLILPPVD